MFDINIDIAIHSFYFYRFPPRLCVLPILLLLLYYYYYYYYYYPFLVVLLILSVVAFYFFSFSLWPCSPYILSFPAGHTWHWSGNNRIYWVGMFEAQSVSVKNEHTHTHTHTHVQFNKYTHTHTHTDQCEWHRMTRMTAPDCVVMCNLINTHTHTHTHKSNKYH